MKIILILSLCSSLSLINILYSQCPNQDYNFFDQSSIDLFQINYPDCDTINGNVTITSYSVIDSLNGLSSLEVINGDLEISLNQNLASLKGLDNLQIINGTLTLLRNENLTNLENLASLKKLEKLILSKNGFIEHKVFSKIDSIQTLQVDGNGGINNLYGFENLKYLETLHLTDSISFEGFPTLDSLKYLSIRRNPAIKSYKDISYSINGHINHVAIFECNQFSIDGINDFKDGVLSQLYDRVIDLNLDAISDINYEMSLTIRKCGGFSDLTPLQDVPLIQLGLWDIPGSITSLNELHNIENVLRLYLLDNKGMVDISNVENFKNLEALHLEKNPLLSICNQEPICILLQEDLSNVLIVNNAPGCESVEAILEQCTSSNEDIFKWVKIYPNPATNKLIISTNNFEFDQYEIFDFAGKNMTGLRPFEKEINFTFSSGMYYLKLYSDKEFRIIKFVVQ